jgi:hypothetical protein
MKCWHCETELIWGADHDIDDDDTYNMVTNLHCPKCYCVIDVYYPSEKTIKEYEEYEKKHLN